MLELDPGNTWASVSARRLEPIVKARHEKLKVRGALQALHRCAAGAAGCGGRAPGRALRAWPLHARAHVRGVPCRTR